ncbi:hypothetical protein VaNZ11_008968 [Volvox africanus]|uniref:OBG-type G domain-containing protein n=1 Tax=Volvox africanus TaxID=51714 RepID=A0ABQ5S6B9_9CHLO|nr:hypothetical protein VaNZ11_008968 [Volvox africanus]
MWIRIGRIHRNIAIVMRARSCGAAHSTVRLPSGTRLGGNMALRPPLQFVSSWSHGYTSAIPGVCGSLTTPAATYEGAFLCPSPVNSNRSTWSAAAASGSPNDAPSSNLINEFSATSSNTAGSSTAASTVAQTSVLALRFRAGRRRMTALERAAAAAHDALAAARPAASASPARPPRSATITAAMPPRFDRSQPAELPRSAGRLANDTGTLAMEEENAEEQQQAEEQRRRFVGHLQGVPHVILSQEHLQSARKRASRVTPSAGIKNEAEKARSRAARRLDVLMKELSVPLGRYLSGFPQPERLHPFEAALLALTVGEATYRTALQRVDKLRKAVQEVGKGAASKAANAPNKAAATALSEEGAEAIEAVFTAGARHIDALKEIAKKLRSLPSLDTSLPTLALVGAPNVGKSSLVNILSSGTPEVCNYPFTTRSIKMGHFYLDSQKHQVTDTPGLLRRPDVQRNRMEQLTLAALGCLDTAILFVIDLTEECGTSVADQWAIRGEVRSRFPNRPWLDVLSKGDMLQDTLSAADTLMRQRAAAAVDVCSGSTGGGGSGYAALTATDAFLAEATKCAGVGGEVERAKAGLRVQFDSGREVKGSGHVQLAETDTAVGTAEEEIVSAVEAAARLPTAIRISSLTHDGIPQLQLAIIQMLRAQAQAQRAQHQHQSQQQHQEQWKQQDRHQSLLGSQVQPEVQAAGNPPVVTFFTL